MIMIVFYCFNLLQALTDACHYTLNFPQHLDIKVSPPSDCSTHIKYIDISDQTLYQTIVLTSSSQFKAALLCHLITFQLKSALIGALFLIDFMYGEKPK